MKILPPDIPFDLHTTTNLATVLRTADVLSELNVREADAAGLKVRRAVIKESKFVTCDFGQTAIEKLQVRDCIFEHCDLTAGAFPDSAWHAVEVRNSRCSGIRLQTSKLKNVRFKYSKLDLANFRYAHLENVVFESCVVTELDLYGATLKNVAFIDCDIENVTFSEAKLQKVDLSGSRLLSIKGLRGLRGAIINHEQLQQLAPYLAAELGIVVKD